MKTILLNGDWKIFFDDGLRGGSAYQHIAPYNNCKWFDATVPGEIHQDLMNLNIIDNIYEYDNILKARWVEEQIWTYRRTFNLDKRMLTQECCLELNKLNLNAKIFLNGNYLCSHDNFFYPCVIEVGDKLREGENVLLVQIESGLFANSDNPVNNYFTATLTEDIKLHKRIWMRKPQCECGWDWTQRLLNVGIGGDVCLKFYDNFRVGDTCITAIVENDYSLGKIVVKQDITPKTSSKKEETINLAGISSVSANVNEKFICTTKLCIKILDNTYIFEHDITTSTTQIISEIIIDNPMLWNPIGYGNQNLYEVMVYIDDFHIVSKEVGFRKVIVNQDKHPVSGSYFIFEINDNKIFAKGSNLVPIDMLMCNRTNDKYDKIVDKALEAGFNFLRIWGGGLYEEDYFYDLCNKKGILVWQEFIFACATYPVHDIMFKNSVLKEAAYNIKRLSSNPSLIAWCGNNEQEWQTFTMGEGKIQHPDYVLYHCLLPVLLKELDPSKYYQPSSPFSPDHNLPNLDNMGDQHPWGVGIGNQDFYMYRNYECRFPNEGGLLGPTGLINHKKCLRENQRYLHSFDYYIHDNILENYSVNPSCSPDEMTEIFMDIEASKLELSEYIFLGGLLHSEGLKEYINNFSRRKYDVSGAIFWMFNDYWPCTRSWTIIDSCANKTPAFNSVKRAFRDIKTVIVHNSQTLQYDIYAVNDTLISITKTIEFGFVKFDGEYILSNQKEILFEANTSTLVLSLDANAIDSSDATPYTLMDGVVERMFILRFKELKLKTCQIMIEKCNDGFVLKSDKFVWGVCLGINGDEDYSDNFFDMLPNRMVHIKTTQEFLDIMFTGNQFIKKS